jgi:hypothetical protein
MKGLIVGPWVGEFGWELFSWHAYCRSLSNLFDKIIVISRPGRNVLYDDFCTKYIEYDPGPGNVDSYSHSNFTSFNVHEFLKNNGIILDSEYRWHWLGPTKIGEPPYTHWNEHTYIHNFGLIRPTYFELGSNDDEKKYDLVIHARNRNLRKEDNWSIEKWESVVNEFMKQDPSMKICSIGTYNESFHIPGTDDFRNRSLNFICDILNNSRCIVGPSSGPLHLATLCKTPQVWWTSPRAEKYNTLRYEYTWNPFDVKTFRVKTQNGDPDVLDVINGIKRFVK